MSHQESGPEVVVTVGHLKKNKNEQHGHVQQHVEEEVEADESLLDSYSGDEGESGSAEDSAVFYNNGEEERILKKTQSDNNAVETEKKKSVGSAEAREKDRDAASISRVDMGSEYRTV